MVGGSLPVPDWADFSREKPIVCGYWKTGFGTGFFIGQPDDGKGGNVLYSYQYGGHCFLL